MPAMRQGVVAQPRGLAQPDACAHACGRGALRGRELGSDARPYDRRARPSTTVIGGAQHLWDNGQKIVGVLVLFTAVIAPALQIGLMLAIVLGAMREPAPRWVGALLRHHPTTRIWSMIEVMMVGVLVALVKIADYATVIPGLALFVLWVLVFLLAGLSASFDSREVWQKIQWADEAQREAVGNSLAGETS